MNDPIPASPVSTLECRSCGAGAPVDEHFCPQCSRILALGRHGDYFSFLGLPRKLVLDRSDLEQRFRELSRRFHPDYYYNAPPAERLASLERSSYLNDAYRTLRNPVARIEHLLAIEGLPSVRSDDTPPAAASSRAEAHGAAAAKVPPRLLEEVFELNEELDAIREARESGTGIAQLRTRLQEARKPIEARREAHEREVDALSARWDRAVDAADRAEQVKVLGLLRERLLERNYISNLLAGIDREAQGLETGAPATDLRP